MNDHSKLHNLTPNMRRLTLIPAVPFRNYFVVAILHTSSCHVSNYLSYSDLLIFLYSLQSFEWAAS